MKGMCWCVKGETSEDSMDNQSILNRSHGGEYPTRGGGEGQLVDGTVGGAVADQSGSHA